ncbi:MAG: class I SAM-dependent methyltransferase [Acidimicrobiales bacterium]
MGNVQEQFYREDFDYRRGGPHLLHSWLYERLVRLLRDELVSISGKGLPPTVLEIGAGHGGYTEPVLAAGWEVTGVETSRPSLRTLQERFARNDRFHPVYSEDGSLGSVGEEFSMVLGVSVLHHIPDYLSPDPPKNIWRSSLGH